jgi:hypothetical protein
VRPTVEEHLSLVAQSLQDMVGPAVEPGPATAVLSSAVKSLRALAAGWDKVLPFLHEDNALLEQFLQRHDLQGLAELGLPAPGDPAEVPQVPFDVAAANRRNESLRSALSNALSAPGCSPALLSDCARLLSDRSQRYPIRLIPDLPSGQSEAAGG